MLAVYDKVLAELTDPTPQSTVLFEKPTNTQLLKNSPTFYAT
jgi:hypothetical protein